MERTIEPNSVPGMKELEAVQETDFAKLCEEPLLTNAASCADVRTAQIATFAKSALRRGNIARDSCVAA